eukprot:Pgem_evm1s3409
MEVKIPMLARVLYSISVYDLVFYTKEEDEHRNCLLDINIDDRPVNINVYDAQIKIARERANDKTYKIIRESVSLLHQHGIMGMTDIIEVFMYFQESYNNISVESIKSEITRLRIGEGNDPYYTYVKDIMEVKTFIHCKNEQLKQYDK